jgi:uncharacterized membrane protein YphA (DoxX/SURF4 family)
MRTEIIEDSRTKEETPGAITVLSWVLRLIAAVILLQTLFFKFTAAPESVYIFAKVGAEPWGRIGSGIVELIAAALLLAPRLNWLGSLIALAVMAGAITSHLTVLGFRETKDCCSRWPSSYSSRRQPTWPFTAERFRSSEGDSNERA